MMRFSRAIPLAAVLLSASSLASAASSTDLAVKGLITPSACTLDLPGGVVDHGKISAKDLNQDSHTQLEAKTLQLSVSCEAKTLFAIVPIDNRAGSGSISGDGVYGLGLVNGTQKLGFYELMLRNPVTDLPSAILLELRYEDRWMDLWPEDPTTPNRMVAFGNFSMDVGYFPEPVKNAAVEIVINSRITPARNLTLTNEVALDGSATLELKYL